jgi:predicted anti-sigma-YlaC factor YlaD
VLHRRVRVAPAPSAADLTERVVAALPGRSAPARRRALLSARIALGVVGLLQLAMAGPVLLLGHDHAAPVHVAHEVGSFDAALALGLLLAAVRPPLARGMLPLVGAITALLLVTAGSDLAAGRTALLDEAPHVVDLAGFLLLANLTPLTSRRTRAGQNWRNA